MEQKHSLIIKTNSMIYVIVILYIATLSLFSVVEVDLKNLNFHPGKARYQQVLDAFTRLPLVFSWWLVWLPHGKGMNVGLLVG